MPSQNPAEFLREFIADTERLIAEKQRDVESARRALRELSAASFGTDNPVQFPVSPTEFVGMNKLSAIKRYVLMRRHYGCSGPAPIDEVHRALLAGGCTLSDVDNTNPQFTMKNLRITARMNGSKCDHPLIYDSGSGTVDIRDEAPRAGLVPKLRKPQSGQEHS